MLCTLMRIKSRQQFKAILHALPSQPIANIPAELPIQFTQVNKHSLLKREPQFSPNSDLFCCLLLILKLHLTCLNVFCVSTSDWRISVDSFMTTLPLRALLWLLTIYSMKCVPCKDQYSIFSSPCPKELSLIFSSWVMGIILVQSCFSFCRGCVLKIHWFYKGASQSRNISGKQKWKKNEKCNLNGNLYTPTYTSVFPA